MITAFVFPAKLKPFSSSMCVFFSSGFSQALGAELNLSYLQESALAERKPSFSSFSCLGLVFRVSVYPGNKI